MTQQIWFGIFFILLLVLVIGGVLYMGSKQAEESEFEEWVFDVKRLAIKTGWSEPYIKSLDMNRCRHYFEEGYTPQEAIERWHQMAVQEV